MRGLVTLYEASQRTRLPVYLDASAQTTLSSLLPTLANICGARSDVPTSIGVDGAIADPSASLSQVELHEGSWISLQPQGTAPVQPYANTDAQGDFVQLRFISGVHAGTVYDVSQGTMAVMELFGAGGDSPGVDAVFDIGSSGITLTPQVSGKPPKKRHFWSRSRGTDERHSRVFVKDTELTEPTHVDFGQEIVLPRCVIAFSDTRGDQVPLDTQSAEGHWLFARPPKIHTAVKNRRFTMSAEPGKPTKSPIPLASTLLPLAMALGMAYFLKNAMFLAFGIMSPMMMIASYVSGNRSGRKRYKQELIRYTQISERVNKQARLAVDAEITYGKREYPDPTAVLDICTRHTAQLWNRRISDDSWLALRVGTGTVPSSVTVENPQKLEFERVRSWKLHAFPVTVSLSDSGCVGVTGDVDTILPVTQWMVCQLAALHSTRDLNLYLLAPTQHQRSSADSGAAPATAVPVYGASRKEMDWNFTQWLPHFAPHLGQNAVRTVATNAQTLALRIAELGAILDERLNNQKNQSMKKWAGSSIVMVMEHAHVLRSMPGMIRLLQEGPRVGIFALCLDMDERLLPEECQTIISAEGDILRMRSNVADDVSDIMPDKVTSAWVDAVSLALSPIEDGSPDETQSAIPSQSRLLTLLKLTPTADQIEARWALQPRSTACVIGESVDGAIGLDISKDGPHGLIAGTTGSGKSELLQSLVASLAVANTPDALNFVLVDYKGGAAFKDCVKLPHTVGMVTDLDNHLVSRALVSLGAELNYREHLLAVAGAKDLEDYIDLQESSPTLTTIPRLLIVIDEFASLARELPDFVTGLVNIAQRGRSLGIHLLLATQRPGGVVSPEIRANTNLRIALRMTDATESQDVIDAKDAALIGKNTPGRAVMRLGSNSLIPFQSARVGGRYLDPKTDQASVKQRPFVRVMPLSRLSMPAPQRPQGGKRKGDVAVTDLKKLVESIMAASAHEGFGMQRQPWMPALPQHVDLATLTEPGNGRDGRIREASALNLVPIPFAIGDYPQRQAQENIAIDLHDFGNLFIVGTSRSGKSTALRTIAYAAASLYRSSDLHLYCVDCGNGAITPLSALPNVGVVALRSETEKIQRLLNRLERESKSRASQLSNGGFSDINEYNQHAGDSGAAIPHILVLLDSWEGFNTVFQNYDNGSLVDAIQLLLREGPSVGIHLILTGDKQLLTGRMSILSDSKILLRMVDNTDYTEVGLPSREVPDEIPDGRGFRSQDSAEIQVAQINPSLTGQQESTLIRQTGHELATGRDGAIPSSPKPFSIEQLPDDLALGDIPVFDDGAPGDGLQPIPLGVGGENNDALLWRPASLPMLPIFGTRGSGKTTSLVTVVNGALRRGYRVCIVAPRNTILRKFTGMAGVDGVISDPHEVTTERLEAYLHPEVPGTHTIVVFDDSQMLKDIPASPWIQSHIGVMDPGPLSFAFAGDANEFPQGFSNWGNKLKTLKQGLLLRPDDIMQQDVIGIRLKRGDVSGEVPVGRGFAHIGGQLLHIQIARSAPGDASPSAAAGPAPTPPVVAVSPSASASGDIPAPAPPLQTAFEVEIPSLQLPSIPAPASVHTEEGDEHA